MTAPHLRVRLWWWTAAVTALSVAARALTAATWRAEQHRTAARRALEQRGAK